MNGHLFLKIGFSRRNRYTESGECGQMLASSFSAVPGDSEGTTKKKTPLKTGTSGTQKDNQHASDARGKRPGDHLEKLKRVVTLV